MIIFLFGEERSFLMQEKQRLISQFRKKYPEGSVLFFDGEEKREDVFGQYQTQAQPELFQTKKLLAFSHPVSLDSQKAKALFEFLETQKESKDTVHIIVDPRKAKKGDKLQKTLTALAGTVKEFSKISEKDYRVVVRALEKEYERAGDLEKNAERELRERVGSNVDRLQSELIKLFSYKPKGPITLQDVDALVQKTPELKVFDALDALASEQKQVALRQFRGLLDETDVYQLVGMCAWQLRRMLQVAALVEEGNTNSSSIAKTTGLPPFVVQKILRHSEAFPLKRLTHGMRLLSDLDVDLKQGKKDGRAVIDTFVFQL